MTKVRNEDLDDFMKSIDEKHGKNWPVMAAKLAIIWFDRGEELQKKVDKLEMELDLEKRKHAGGVGE